MTPDTVKVVRGKGMPISKSPGQHGDLRIKFKVGTAVLALCAATAAIYHTGARSHELCSASWL